MEAGATHQCPSVWGMRSLARRLKLVLKSPLSRSETVWALEHRFKLVWSATSANQTMRIIVHTRLVSNIRLYIHLCSSRSDPHTIHADTYGSPYSDGTISQGGYSSHIRAHEYFTFKIPDAIPTHEAAPMMCAGITTFSPMHRAGVGPGKKVAVVGV